MSFVNSWLVWRHDWLKGKTYVFKMLVFIHQDFLIKIPTFVLMIYSNILEISTLIIQKIKMHNSKQILKQKILFNLLVFVNDLNKQCKDPGQKINK